MNIEQIPTDRRSAPVALSCQRCSCSRRMSSKPEPGSCPLKTRVQVGSAGGGGAVPGPPARAPEPTPVTGARSVDLCNRRHSPDKKNAGTRPAFSY